MYQIRKNVFETNSSSTHSICIPKKEVDPYSVSHIEFKLGEFGWEDGEANPADYLYTAIMCNEHHEENLERLKDILYSYGITCDFETPVFASYTNADGSVQKYLSWESGSIDHGSELEGAIEAILSDPDMLMRYLLGATKVYTGNDNTSYGWDGEAEPMCGVANEYSWVNVGDSGNYDNDWEYKKTGNYNNPAYDPENYDYFYKGN